MMSSGLCSWRLQTMGLKYCGALAHEADVACTAGLLTTAAATTTSTTTTSEPTTWSSRTPDDTSSTLTGRVLSNARAQVTVTETLQSLSRVLFRKRCCFCFWLENHRL